MNSGNLPTPEPLIISSAHNPLLKKIRRAAQKGTLTEDGYCIAETFHLVEEAVASGCEVPFVIVAESARSRSGHLRGNSTRQVHVPDDLFNGVATTEHAQGIMALVRPPAWSMEHLFSGQPLVLVLDRLQDPGNAGTILRTAEAFGATGVVTIKGTVSLLNPKTVRASAGSVFRIPSVSGVSVDTFQEELHRRQTPLWAAMPRASRILSDLHLTGAMAFAIGSEGGGISPELAALADSFRIPTVGVESLNASAAAAVILYEAAKQRNTGL
ncbi:MAG TPA: RNA methyltransferase [Bryobacteraceae bacterium]|nr:RNA methyltransferase [Bryobacteraceae bacterium]